ncbi:MAG: hypothetical protein JST93_19180 [Acidobacteria bacterium]|nr:hypothetical protein [Acidobacteriota bacterium]
MNANLNQLKTNELPDEARTLIIRNHLALLSASPALSKASSLRRLLEYVVRASLDGRQDTLKEYELGVAVFERGPDFDPRVDTIVRVQARKLRQRLTEYYEQEGANSPVRIILSPGAYAPEFHFGPLPAVVPPPPAPRRRWTAVAVAACLSALSIGFIAGHSAGVRSASTPSMPLSLGKFEALHPSAQGTSIANRFRTGMGQELRRINLTPLDAPASSGLEMTGAVEILGSRVRMDCTLRSLKHNTAYGVAHLKAMPPVRLSSIPSPAWPPNAPRTPSPTLNACTSFECAL